MARRSTRLSSRNSTTPQPIKRVSLSHETPTTRAPCTVPAKLASLNENDEMPGAFPGSPNEQDTPTIPSKRVKTVEPQDATPKSAAPVEAPLEEMHPKHLHQSTAKPREEARWLGFSNMPPATEPPKRNSKLAEAQATPSRTTKQEHAFRSPDFTFTFRREQSLELSPEAKKLMDEKRAEALRIKDQMKSAGEGSAWSGEALSRKIAQPKSKKGRFSELHDAQFQKMDSIAGHASAYRKDPTRLAASGADRSLASQTPSKSLKRSPSKAELDKTDGTPSKSIPRVSSKPNLAQPGSQLRRAPSMKNLREATAAEATPAKRVKRADNDDVSNTRPASSDKEKSLPSTPQHLKESRAQPSYPNLAHLSTPTQSSLARAASVKSTKTTSKIPGLSLTRSPTKAHVTEPSKDHPDTSTPLLAKSPAKGELFPRTNKVETVGTSGKQDPPKPMMDAALARTPAKSGMHKPSRPDQDNSPSPQKKETQAPLLSRSHLKVSVTKDQDVEGAGEKQPSMPLLSQSPSKASQDHNPFVAKTTQSAVKSTGNSLVGRFNLLRSSPIKSILRSPQRLYSNDPSKIAAGTHFATPPKLGGDKASKLPGPPPATAPVRKHVDFSSSTKAREATKSLTPSDEASSPSQADAASESVSENAGYPTLPTVFSPVANPTHDRRRQTIAPGDFTFRAGDGIVFGNPSLAPPASAKSTIRHVSAEPEIVPSGVAASQKKRKFDFENKLNANPAELSPTVTPGSKKRKFNFENDTVAKAAESVSTSDKENGGSEDAQEEDASRPKKRVKSAPAPAKGPQKPAPKASRMPTLGVKPKAGANSSGSGAKDEKKKSSTSISMARLNALAMPKRRG
ncbi:hypothetical protein WHR41_00364 [Cladosporium halotolerans]|uniref:Erythromycin esterase n=1 Tax=Cladosporium halotolerans TaxID=1052096 RepID=A0AB34L1G3_9PEZI